MATEEKYKQAKMVNWYNPAQLYATALKAVVSGAFASYADKRELQAALDLAKAHIDCSKDDETKQPLDELWIDFISDTGDGFNPTYTVADLVAQPLSVMLNPDYKDVAIEKDKTWDLPQGDLLLLGGDQVYPTPSVDQYDNRFKVPFKAASKKHHQNDKRERKLFVIPGNHDWYDGLGNFIKIFCQKRRIGNWRTSQKRSYFALKLPHHYWLWATDVQLNSDVDQPQKDYFQDIATKHMESGDKVILCTAEPAWVNIAIHRKDESYKRLKFIEEYFITCDKDDFIKDKKFKLVATITGDLHHYSRYEEYKKTHDDHPYINHLITAGGGGAFLHPTHNLPYQLKGLDVSTDSILKSAQFKEPKLKACFPSKKASRKLANSVLLFPFHNIAFLITMALVQFFLIWMLQSTSQFEQLSFVQQLARVQGIGNFFIVIFNHLVLNPPVVMICVLVLLGMTMFTDRNSGKMNYWWLGCLHGIVQLFNMFLFIWFMATRKPPELGYDTDEIITAAFMVGSILLSGFTGSLIMGFYLWFTNCFLDIHMNESFSSLSQQHYKNFLRIHITPEGTVSIYPIGIEKVVTEWKQHDDGEDMTFDSTEKAMYYLIEPPIIIQNI